jgi:hypothetical protein
MNLFCLIAQTGLIPISLLRFELVVPSLRLRKSFKKIFEALRNLEFLTLKKYPSACCDGDFLFFVVLVKKIKIKPNLISATGREMEIQNE